MIYQEHVISTPHLYCRVFYSTTSPGARPMQPHRHLFPEIALFMAGGGVYQTQDTRYRCRQGDVFFFNSNVVHYLTEIDGDQPLLLMNVQYDPSAFAPGELDPELQLPSQGGKVFLAEGEENNGPKRIMELIHAECAQARSGWQIMVEANLLTLLVSLSRRAEAASLPENTRRFEWMDRVTKYISQHLCEDISLESLAGVAGFSRTYFSAMFHECTGMRVWDYVTQKRILLAAQWLAGSTAPITEIALRCGFNNTVNFNRAFQKYMSQTPTSFRKMALSAVEKA